MSSVSMFHVPKKFSLFLFATAISLILPLSSAQATYDWWGLDEAKGSPNGELTVNQGVYDSFVLGDDLTFSACTTTFAGYSLCDLPDLSKFVIQWAVETRNSNGTTQAYQWIGSWTEWTGTTEAGKNVTVSSDANTSIFGVGTFYIGVHIVAYSGTYIPLPDGSYAYTGSNVQDGGGWVWTAATVSPTSQTSPSTPSVPEPAAALLLLPALALVARRERKKRKKAQQAIA